MTTAAKPAPAAPAAAPVAAAAPAKPAPIVDVNAQPAAPPTVATAKPNPIRNEEALEIGAGVLALLALGGAGVAVARRRRSHRELIEEQEAYAAAEAARAESATNPRHDPVLDEQPAIIAPDRSAFAWGNSPSAAEPADGRRAGETWVERAMRGPTPDNPSLSLRKRLKRAAFFDNRERQVAQGDAEPVDPTAGLSDKMEMPDEPATTEQLETA